MDIRRIVSTVKLTDEQFAAIFRDKQPVFLHRPQDDKTNNTNDLPVPSDIGEGWSMSIGDACLPLTSLSETQVVRAFLKSDQPLNSQSFEMQDLGPVPSKWTLKPILQPAKLDEIRARSQAAEQQRLSRRTAVIPEIPNSQKKQHPVNLSRPVLIPPRQLTLSQPVIIHF